MTEKTILERLEIITLKDAGKSWNKIIEYIGNKGVPVAIRTCQRIYKRYKEKSSLENLSTSGRPKIVGEIGKRLIVRWCLTNWRWTVNQSRPNTIF